MSSRIGEKPSKTPALVATAFPPLNPAKIGKVCPKTAKRPKTIGEIPWIPKKVERRTAKVPFKKSITKTMIPAFFPKIRKVLVVPVLPEPCSRKLIWKKIFPIHNPEEWSLTDRLKLKHLFLLSYSHYIKKPTIEKAISGVQVWHLKKVSSQLFLLRYRNLHIKRKNLQIS